MTWPILCDTPPKMLVVTNENLMFFNKNSITTKLSINPANDSANLTAFPNSTPIIISLKMLIKNVHFMSKICSEIKVMMFASPIFIPKLPTSNGNKISIYDKIREILKNIMAYGKIVFFCCFISNILFDIFLIL